MKLSPARIDFVWWVLRYFRDGLPSSRFLGVVFRRIYDITRFHGQHVHD